MLNWGNPDVPSHFTRRCRQVWQPVVVRVVGLRDLDVCVCVSVMFNSLEMCEKDSAG